MIFQSKRDFEQQADEVFTRLRELKLPQYRPAHFIIEPLEKYHKRPGWWCTLGWLERKIKVGFSTDDWPTKGKQQILTGFWSAQQRTLEKLFKRLPRHLQPGETRKVDEVEFKTRYPTRRIALQTNIAEFYGAREAWFGRYSSMKGSVTTASGFISNVIQALAPIDDLEADIRQIQVLEKKETSRKQLIDARLGQGAFRRDVATTWGGEKCCVTGCAVPEALRASHIKAWRVSSPKEKLDKNNGLLLLANIDALFDKHLVSFDETGVLLVSSIISDNDLKLLSLSTPATLKLNSEQRKYMRHHRDEHLKLGSSRKL